MADLIKLGAQCSQCSFYQRGRSIEMGRHLCSGFPGKLPAWFADDSQKCPIGPVGGGRKLGVQAPKHDPATTPAAKPPEPAAPATKTSAKTAGRKSTPKGGK